MISYTCRRNWAKGCTLILTIVFLSLLKKKTYIYIRKCISPGVYGMLKHFKCNLLHQLDFLSILGLFLPYKCAVCFSSSAVFFLFWYFLYFSAGNIPSHHAISLHYVEWERYNRSFMFGSFPSSCIKDEKWKNTNSDCCTLQVW